MTHVVTESCIRCKYTDCIDVCPVECFHGGEVMLAINPHACIDCAACVPVCPSHAIVPASKPEAQRWLELNARMSAVWPQMLDRRADFEDADLYKNQPAKYEKFFTENAQSG
jgi:ferredoxin